jgi:hypothetical protein
MIAKLQAERRRANDALPQHEWHAKRQALIDSGMVEERRQMRDCPQAPDPHGVYKARILSLMDRADIMIHAGREKAEQTLVDALYEEKHGL